MSGVRTAATGYDSDGRNWQAIEGPLSEVTRKISTLCEHFAFWPISEVVTSDEQTANVSKRWRTAFVPITRALSMVAGCIPAWQAASKAEFEQPLIMGSVEGFLG
jgi:hypothetical protein